MLRPLADRIEENDHFNELVAMVDREVPDFGLSPLVPCDKGDYLILMRDGVSVPILPEESQKVIDLLTQLGRANGVIR